MRENRPTVQDPASAESTDEANRRFAQGLTHAFGGAVVFSFPMLMTMEMWWLGFYMDPFRLALFIALNLPLLIGLSRYVGFEPGSQPLSDILDAFAAYAVGFAAAALLLLLFAIIGPGMSANEIIGKIAVQAVPASIGAALARSQYGEREREDEKRRSARYGGGLFLMGAGALYLSASVAATEEMMLISYKMTAGHVVVLLVFSLAVMHGFVHAVVAQGKTAVPPKAISFWPVFLRFTVAGYGIALLISVFMLWIFGRAGGLEAAQVVQATVVLGFPAALGAGAARLLL
ncbi:MAG: TIGR02587 family membrane protein [Nitrosospira sp.]|nr:TIGR02587 family membrane protein [Nitrosospira sp.]